MERNGLRECRVLVVGHAFIEIALKHITSTRREKEANQAGQQKAKAR